MKDGRLYGDKNGNVIFPTVIVSQHKEDIRGKLSHNEIIMAAIGSVLYFGACLF